MAEFIVSKVLDALPDELTPSTLYFVRTGPGFDIYLTDKHTPATATRLNDTVVVEDVIQDWWNNSSAKTKLDGVATGATKNATDAQLRDRTTHTGEQPISSVTGLQTALDSKVDKVSGKQLSTEDFTSALKDKLNSLEGSHWRGTFVSLAALQAGVANPTAGDYADVNTAGVGVKRYVWNAVDGVWVVQSGEVSPITASEVKQLYESNPDTNTFTDAEKDKLGGIEAGAQVNTVTSVNGRTGAVTGLVENADSRLSNSREWSADTVAQAEAESGTSTTRRAWTAQRIRQAIAAWWNSITDVFGRDLVTSSTNAVARNKLGLSDASTTSVAAIRSGTTWDNVQGKPSTYTPSAHTHTWSQITGQPATATRWPTFAEVTGKPGTYAPNRSTSTVEGGIKTRISGDTLWMTNNGNDA